MKNKQPQSVISDVSITNAAAPCSPEQALSLEELARAAAALAIAISDIAKSLKGAEAHMKYGIAVNLKEEP